VDRRQYNELVNWIDVRIAPEVIDSLVHLASAGENPIGRIAKGHYHLHMWRLFQLWNKKVFGAMLDCGFGVLVRTHVVTRYLATHRVTNPTIVAIATCLADKH
jgi:hypothetical protein